MASTQPTVLLRRRRLFALCICLFLGFIVYVVAPWEPATDIKEVYGLLHLVTRKSEPQYLLNSVDDINPESPMPMSIYAAGKTELNWRKEIRSLNKKYPVVVFSKTYCPYSKKAKELLASYNIQPPPKIIEVDLRDDQHIIKTLLGRITGRATFPNILLNGESIGGSDDLQQLHMNNVLPELLRKAGVLA